MDIAIEGSIEALPSLSSWQPVGLSLFYCRKSDRLLEHAFSVSGIILIYNSCTHPCELWAKTIRSTLIRE